ncbi:MAG: sigma-54-dependent Fis family transcriptional regulator [candidate division Zixibacteria bacterium HGW-Zixibacteria-1]|nr:MAG: sigma-54-dependent Fis family transcriptional regulator [candidate division Zixibacteria bacterium HGW-Zixibacteria-1]
MIQNVLILANGDLISGSSGFEKIFRPIGEFVEEVSLLYTLLKERAVDLILIPEIYPKINRGVVRRMRLRNPQADIWQIVWSDTDSAAYEIYDGTINIDDGPEQIAKKVQRILHQKSLLKKYNIIGRSEKMKVVAETIDRIAPTDISILIVGPSGSGKELVARAIHENSSRAGGRFVAINCGAIAEGVLESELFGHEKGAFTGSVASRVGMFIRANDGTILLDEIGETKLDMQVKLLRVLEDGYFYPVGGDKPVHSNARVIAATNRDLIEAIHSGDFREDLYFRLGVVKIVLPALYDRRQDILPLLCHFSALEKVKGFSDSALDLLLRYDWPGNVRELRNFLARMGALHPDSEISAIDVEQFISEQAFESRNLPVVTGHTHEEAGHELIYHALLQLGSEIKMLRDLITVNLQGRSEFETVNNTTDDTAVYSDKTMKDIERVMIETALRECGGNRKTAAKKLGIGERTLYRKIKEYNLN